MESINLDFFRLLLLLLLLLMVLLLFFVIPPRGIGQGRAPGGFQTSNME